MPIKVRGRFNAGSFFQTQNTTNPVITIDNLNSQMTALLEQSTSTFTQNIQKKIEFDEIPTQNSLNSMYSKDLYTAFSLKVNISDLSALVPISLNYDGEPIQDSNNLIKSGILYNLFNEKADISYVDTTFATLQQLNLKPNYSDIVDAIAPKQDTLTSTSVINIQDVIASTGTFNSISVNNYINLTKSTIGLSNVDNTSDINKPISTFVQNALNLKQNILTFDNIPIDNSVNIVRSGDIKNYVDATISNLIDSAPEALNTLKELSTALNDDANFASTMTTTLALKANITYVDNIIGNLNLQAGNNSIDTNSPVFFNKISIVDSSNTYVEITPSRLFFSSGFSYSGGSGSSSTTSFQPTQSYFGFSNTNNNNNYSFLTGYTWNTLKFNSVGANNISGLTYDNNGEFSIPAGTYQINWFAHYAEENDTRYLGFQHGTSVSPETDTGVMQVYSTFLTQSHTFSTIFIFTQTTGFRMWTGGNNKSNSIVARNNNLIITKLA